MRPLGTLKLSQEALLVVFKSSWVKAEKTLSGWQARSGFRFLVPGHRWQESLIWSTDDHPSRRTCLVARATFSDPLEIASLQKPCSHPSWLGSRV